MIKAKAVFNEADRYVRLEVEGHAGHGERGRDVTCSAASILVYTAAQIIRAMHHTGCYVEGKPTVNLESGKAMIEITCKGGKEYNEMHFALLFFKAGFALLQNNEPDYVRFIIDEA